MNPSITAVPYTDLTTEQQAFMHRGGVKTCYDLGVSRDSKEGHADWYLFLSQDAVIQDYMGVVLLSAVVDGQPMTMAGIGGQLAPSEAEMTRAHILLDAVESLITERWPGSPGLLFCLPEWIPYFEPSGWITLRQPVTFEREKGPTTFPASAMTYKGKVTCDSIIHIPKPT